MDFGYIEKNVENIRKRIADAAKNAGRDEEDITMLAAVKYADEGEIDFLCRELGVRDIGENRVQQLLAHHEALEYRDQLNWHFIGTLQTNKVKYIIDKVCMIHSLDSLKLAAEIDRQAKKHGVVMDVLVEINSGEEESKSGLSPGQGRSLCGAAGSQQMLLFQSFFRGDSSKSDGEDSGILL